MLMLLNATALYLLQTNSVRKL
ncbi:hypothetical protein PCC21_018700 [Pectobacterium carotovorum subsp. carotovorum PCC21]|nr:hypothetical protein PCC21_018700 [Pectobacterium carotovorum subsp. carotovorum PCC21]